MGQPHAARALVSSPALCRESTSRHRKSLCLDFTGKNEEMSMWWSTLGVIVALTLSLLAALPPVEAQPTTVPRIGVLAVDGGMVSTPERFQAEFRETLRERGYVEGQTILVDYCWVAAGQTDRLNDLAVELVQLPVDLMV